MRGGCQPSCAERVRKSQQLIAFTFAQTEVINELLNGFSRRVFLAILN